MGRRRQVVGRIDGMADGSYEILDFKTGTAPVPGEPAATSAWVAGGRGSAGAVVNRS